MELFLPRTLIKLFVIIITVLISSCAQSTKNIKPELVSSSVYDDFDCEKIAIESDYIKQRVNFLTGNIDNEADANSLQTGMSVLFSPFSAIYLKKHSDKEASELSRLKGEYLALRRASDQKECNQVFAEGLANERK